MIIYLMIKFIILSLILMTSNLFAEETSFKCEYEYGYGTSVESGNFKSEIDNASNESLDAIYTVNASEGTAKIISSFESSALSIPGPSSIHIIEITDRGNMNTTTIFLPSLEAVHSRHVDLLGMFVSQYYGKCRLL